MSNSPTIWNNVTIRMAIRYGFVLTLGFFLSFLTAHAQEEVASVLSNQLAESRAKYPSMRPQIFFTQNKYAAGDTAFFRLFILTEDQRVLAERSLLSLELIQYDGSTVSRQNVSCAKFGAANQLILPASLVPGMYEVRLYSDRMNIAYGLSVHLLITGEKQLKPTAKSNVSVKIFPEGGHVVAGLINRLVMQSTLQEPMEGYLYSSKGRVAPVNIDSDGFGSFQFVPLDQESYWIEFPYKGGKVTTQVPTVKPENLTLRVYPGPRKTWVLDIFSTPSGRKQGTLVLLARRQIYHAQEIRLDEQGRSRILVAPDFFPEGYSELFILDQDQRILAYRPVYEPPRPSATLSFSGIPAEAHLRENITTTIKISDEAGSPMTGAFAISVVPSSTLMGTLTTPDATVVLHGNPPSINLNLSREKMEMQLISLGVPKEITPTYPPLISRASLSLSGRALYSDSIAMLPYLSRIVIWLHKDLIQYETGIDGQGYFEFPKIYDFFGNDRIYYQIMTQKKELIPGVRVDWSTNRNDHETPLVEPYLPGEITDEYGTLRKQKEAVERSYGFFLNPAKPSTQEPNRNSVLEDEFQGADVSINPRDYTPFETMQELILEVIPYLEFRMHTKDSTVRVTLLTHSPFVPQRYADGNPLYVIDGWMTSDTRYLMSLSPREILSVKIINDLGKLDKLANLARNGVLFIQTDTPEKTERELTKGMHMIEGLSPTLTHSASYTQNKRVPDLRTLLYWSPQIEADSTGTVNFTFRTSDVPGNYRIRVMGTLNSGHMVSAEKEFVVKFGK
jgi:hypothetical protein